MTRTDSFTENVSTRARSVPAALVRISAAYRPHNDHDAKDTGLVLRPTQPRLSEITLGPEAAQAYIDAGRGADVDPECLVVRRMVADRVLEIFNGGRYVSGAGSVGAGAGSQPTSVPDCISELSRDAVRYAQSIETDDVSVMTRKLYYYNRIPYSSKARRRAEALLGAPGWPTPGTRAGGSRGYSARVTLPWLRIQRHGGDASEKLAKLAKLYISPGPDCVVDVASAAIDYLMSHGVDSFKIASTPQSLCRSDKLIAYFDLPSEAREVGRGLAAELSGLASTAQPVPFSTPLTEDGLLSMGYLPPAAVEGAGRQRLSWRAWICARLAAAMLTARSMPSRQTQPWQFALWRLELDDIDTTAWTPR